MFRPHIFKNITHRHINRQHLISCHNDDRLLGFQNSLTRLSPSPFLPPLGSLSSLLGAHSMRQQLARARVLSLRLGLQIRSGTLWRFTVHSTLVRQACLEVYSTVAHNSSQAIRSNIVNANILLEFRSRRF